jgi:hypothetical protein
MDFRSNPGLFVFSKGIMTAMPTARAARLTLAEPKTMPRKHFAAQELPKLSTSYCKTGLGRGFDNLYQDAL